MLILFNAKKSDLVLYYYDDGMLMIADLPTTSGDWRVEESGYRDIKHVLGLWQDYEVIASC